MIDKEVLRSMVCFITKHLRLCILSICLALLVNAFGFHRGVARELPVGDVSSLRERIEFSVKWSFVTLLKTCMETHGLGNGKDPIFYRLTHQAASNIFWNDRMASIIDSESLLPYRMETVIKEGKEVFVESIVFERDLGKALFSHQEPQTGRSIVDRLEITDMSMDPLSAFYYLRKRLSPGNPSLELEGITGSRRFVLRGRLAAEESIDVPAGNFEVYRVECSFEYWPQGDRARPTRIKSKGKKNCSFTLWVSQDNHRLPVQIRYHLPLGSLWVKAISLTCYEPVS